MNAQATWEKLTLDEVLEDWERMRELEDMRVDGERYQALIEAWTDAGRDAPYLAVPSGQLVTAGAEAQLEIPDQSDDDLKDVMERFAEMITPDTVEAEFAAALQDLEWRSLFSKLLTKYQLADRWEQFRADVATVEIAHWLAGHGYRLRLE